MKKLLGKGKDKIQAALERLDRLTKDEGLSAVAQTLGVVHGIADDMRVVVEGAPYFRDFSHIFVKIHVSLDGKAPTGGIGQNSGICLAQTGIIFTDLRVLSLFTQHQTKPTRRIVRCFPHLSLSRPTYSVGDQLQKDVQHWLSPPDPSTNQNFVSKARHKGTAAWFFESSALTIWKAKGSLLWIHGKRMFFELPMSALHL